MFVYTIYNLREEYMHIMNDYVLGTDRQTDERMYVLYTHAILKIKTINTCLCIFHKMTAKTPHLGRNTPNSPISRCP